MKVLLGWPVSCNNALLLPLYLALCHVVYAEHKERWVLQRGVQPLAAGAYVCIFFVCHFPLSLPVCFSGCHIVLLSQAGRVTVCRWGSGPSVCWEESDIWWAQWTKASGDSHYLLFPGWHPEYVFWVIIYTVDLVVAVAAILSTPFKTRVGKYDKS